ncbi:MAG: DUF1800 domain-containing protein [Gammaproteobacteria bacterium]|nr:DUF1800 domain-containing protein [Gammaproteobacteria bacterium]
MTRESVIAANRFGLGARPGELPDISKDPRGWLLQQLHGPGRTPAEFRNLPRTAGILVEFSELRNARRGERAADRDEPAPDIVRELTRNFREHYLQQTQARYRHAAATDFPFHERLVHFWSNHFAVSADKPPVTAVAGSFENEAIRPHLHGSFAELLVAAEQHPSMILYLDNQRSIGPDSRIGKRANRRRGDREIGLNENLAREILELHTLGVDGGYTQDDVTTFAKVITGWSIGGADPRGRMAEGTPGEFEFRENIHEPGAHRIMGKKYEDRGVRQGEAVLHDLALHPATAKHIATKLARHFVADDPPPQLVESIASAYMESGGDLPTVHAALVNADESWQHTLAKYKTPQDLVVSTFRAFDRVPDDGKLIVGALDTMGHTPYRPGSPAGWPDTAAAWGGADSLYKRIEWSNTVARFVGPLVNPLTLGEDVLGPALGSRTRQAISRAASVMQGMTLLLASPEFQRR